MNQTIRVAEACQSRIAVKNQPEQSIDNQNAKSARMSSHHPEPREQLSNALHREQFFASLYAGELLPLQR
jgi:hypothetical protein